MGRRERIVIELVKSRLARIINILMKDFGKKTELSTIF